MKTEVMFFGQLTDITGAPLVQVDDVKDTDTLRAELCTRYPALTGVRFRIAVDNRIINQNTEITEGSKVAFMPPFSGG